MLNSYLEKTTAPSHPAVFLLGSRIAEDGIQSALMHQARWFHARGYRVVPAFLGDPDGLHRRWQSRLPMPLVDLRAVRAGAGQVDGFFHRLQAVLRTGRLFSLGEFGIFQSFGAEANLFGLRLAQQAGIAVRAAEYPCQPLTARYKDQHTEALLRCATHISAGSEHARRLAIEDGIPEERITLIRRGVAPLDAPEYSARRRLHGELEVPDGGCLVLSAGDLRSPQGYEDLLQAAGMVLEEHPLTRFAVIGEGPARGALVQRARQLGIAAQARFPGRRSDLLKLIAAADVYVVPSAFDGMPPYLLEAMSAGRAVVGPREPRLEEFVQDGETALLAEPGDPPALARRLMRLMAEPELRARLGDAGQAFVRQHHDLERMCARYAVLLDPSYHVEVP